MMICLKVVISSEESVWGGTLTSQGCTRLGWESLKHSSLCTGAILALYTWQEHHGALYQVLRQRLVDMGMGEHHLPCSPPCHTRPSLIRIKMEFQQQWYFFWFLYMFEDDCKKRKFSKKRESAWPGPPEILLAPFGSKFQSSRNYMMWVL